MTDPIEALARFMAPDQSYPWWIEWRNGEQSWREPNTCYIVQHLREIEARLTPDQRITHAGAVELARVESLARILAK